MGAEGANVGTVIEADKGCYSACALVFMAGNRTGPLYRFPERYLHVKGKLGFHAPFLDGLPKGQYDRDTVLNAFRSAQRGTDQLIEAFSVPAGGTNSVPTSPWVHQSLFKLLLSQDPESFLLIDTIDKAGRWGISLYGYRQPEVTKTIDFEALKRACWNMRSWMNDAYAAGKWSAAIANAKFTQIELDFASLGKKTKHALMLADTPEQYCVLTGSTSTTGPPWYFTGYQLTFYTRTNSDFAPTASVTNFAQPWTVFPPETRLAELPARSAY